MALIIIVNRNNGFGFKVIGLRYGMDNSIITKIMDLFRLAKYYRHPNDKF